MPDILLLAQTVSVASLALWLGSGLRDNILYPEMNRTFARQVLGMKRMADEYPEHYELVAHRRVMSERWCARLFGLIVLAETAAVIALVVGVIWLGAAVFGLAAPEPARGAALFGALAFTSVWAAFLICGNHFTYWYCHEAAQTTHFHLTLWGLGTMIFLAI